MSGNLTSMRVIDVSNSAIQTEESFIEKALMKNIENVTNTGTYVENIDTNGTIHGMGKGVITTEENADIISWNAYDLGISHSSKGNENIPVADYGGEHTTTYRGIVFFHTNSEKLSFMNNVVGLYITQVNNEEGSSLRQIWEWK